MWSSTLEHSVCMHYIMYSMQTTMTITHWDIVRNFTNGTRQCNVTLIIALPLTFKLGVELCNIPVYLIFNAYRYQR